MTTGAKPGDDEKHWARSLCVEYGVDYVPREGRTLAALRREAGIGAVLVVAKGGWRCCTAESVLTFHPGMARVRLHNLERGRGDPMVTAMRLRPGDRVLDCTLGLASDAIVASAAVGEEGRVEGLEAVLPVFLVVRDGLERYEASDRTMSAAMRRIRALWAEASEFLSQPTAVDYDVVYLDPFFEKPVEASCGIAPLRAVGLHDQASLRAAAQRALEIATRCVVVKGSRGSRFLRGLPVAQVVTGRRSNVEYSVLSAK